MSSYIHSTEPRACGIASFPQGARSRERLRRDYEFIWVLDGEATLVFHGEQIRAPQHSILLLRPGANTALIWDPWQKTRHAYVQFGVRELPADLPPPEAWPHLRIPTDGDILRPQFKYLLNWYGRGRPELTRVTIEHMLATFITGEAATSEEGPREPTPVEKALGFIHQRMEQDPAIPVHLPQLAKAAGVSQEHLCRAFRDVTGRAPAETVRLARLDRAAVLLARTDFPVQRIARICGFASAFHFSRRFAEAYSQSPRKFRQLIVAGNAPPEPLLARGRKGKRAAEESPQRALFLKSLESGV